MRSLRISAALGLFLVTMLLWSPAARVVAADGGREITVSGRVACLDIEGKRLPPEQDCDKEAPRYELLTAEKQRFRFAADDQLATMFAESRVRRMELQIKGLLHDKDRIELVKIQARRGGRLYDIFYYCGICEITAYAAGPCFCCTNPFEFREVPTRENKP